MASVTHARIPFVFQQVISQKMIIFNEHPTNSLLSDDAMPND
jgi:hypothetical protein